MRFRANSVFGNAADGVPPGRRRAAGQRGPALPRMAASAVTTTSCARCGRAPGGRSSSPSPPGTPTGTSCWTPSSTTPTTSSSTARTCSANSIFFAALAGRRARLAAHLGETELADRWLEAAELGAARAGRPAVQRRVLPSSAPTTSTRTATSTARAACPTSCSGSCTRTLNGLGHLLPRRPRPAARSARSSSTTSDATSATTTACSGRTPSTTSRVWCSAPGRAAGARASRSSTATRSGPASSTRSPPHLIYEGLVDEGLRGRPGGPGPARRRPPQPLERGRSAATTTPGRWPAGGC